ncbi:MAG: hypothetical protein QMC67_11835 [Candidatus Wallbacteria bacterium]
MSKNQNFKILITAVLIALFCAGQAFALPESIKIINKNADAVITLNFGEIYKYLKENKIEGPVETQASKIKNLMAIDILNEIKNFTIVMTDISNYKLGKNPSGAFIFEGNFKQADIERKMVSGGTKFEEYAGSKLYKLGEDLVLTVPSAGFLIYGNTREVKAMLEALLLISNKKEVTDSISKDEYYNNEINQKEFADMKIYGFIKIPEPISQLANKLAKFNSDQAMFENLKGVSFAGGKNTFLIKYNYTSKQAASDSIKKAAAFMETGFSQLAGNSKKINETEPTAVKVNADRLNFAKAGIDLLLKMRPDMKIEAIEDALFIKFDLSKVTKETAVFTNSILTAFINPAPVPAKSPASGK